MMPGLLIVGAKGFAKELLVAVREWEPERSVVFFDDLDGEAPVTLFDKYRVLRSIEEAARHFQEVGPDFAIGIGAPEYREIMFERFREIGGNPIRVISSRASIGEFDNEIGEGAAVLQGAVIEASNRIGKGVLIHIGSLVSHDVRVGDFCEISPRANLLGGVKLGRKCRIGTSATILPRVTLGDEVVVGAGAVVTSDVSRGTTVVGVPAREVKRK